MDKIELIINEIAQNKIEFNEGCKTVLNDKDFNFETIFSCLRNYIFNSIPEKTNYNIQPRPIGFVLASDKADLQSVPTITRKKL
jgi:hypothetical protein